jgi:hypothetical protein
MYARMDHINSLDYDLQSSIRTINRMFIVALWSLAEQFPGRIFKALVSLRTAAGPNKVPYRWDDYKVGYLQETITLEALQDYEIANECRILNNQFKHGEVVSAKLSAFAPYANKIGAELDDLDVEPQRYLNAVSNFLGSLIEQCNEICLSQEST